MEGDKAREPDGALVPYRASPDIVQMKTKRMSSSDQCGDSTWCKLLSGPKEPQEAPELAAWRDPLHGTERENLQLSCAFSARSATGQDTRSGQGALARRHTDGPLRAALLKTTVTCEAWRRPHDAPFDPCSNSCDCSQVPKARSLVPDTDTGTGPIPPVTVFRVKAYSGGVLARALPEGLRYLST